MNGDTRARDEVLAVAERLAAGWDGADDAERSDLVLAVKIAWAAYQETADVYRGDG